MASKILDRFKNNFYLSDADLSEFYTLIVPWIDDSQPNVTTDDRTMIQLIRLLAAKSQPAQHHLTETGVIPHLMLCIKEFIRNEDLEMAALSVEALCNLCTMNEYAVEKHGKDLFQFDFASKVFDCQLQRLKTAYAMLILNSVTISHAVCDYLVLNSQLLTCFILKSDTNDILLSLYSKIIHVISRSDRCLGTLLETSPMASKSRLELLKLLDAQIHHGADKPPTDFVHNAVASQESSLLPNSAWESISNEYRAVWFAFVDLVDPSKNSFRNDGFSDHLVDMVSELRLLIEILVSGSLTDFTSLEYYTLQEPILRHSLDVLFMLSVWIPRKNNIKSTEEHGLGELMFNFKTLLMQLVANLLHLSFSLRQQLTREDIYCILSHTAFDDLNPYVGQWAVFAIRNACLDCMENQRYVEELQINGVKDDSGMLKRMGVEAIVDKGKLSITQVQK